MKKVFAILLLMSFLFAVAGCGRQAPEVKIDYGTSSIYTEKDMEANRRHHEGIRKLERI